MQPVKSLRTEPGPRNHLQPVQKCMISSLLRHNTQNKSKYEVCIDFILPLYQV